MKKTMIGCAVFVLGMGPLCFAQENATAAASEPPAVQQDAPAVNPEAAKPGMMEKFKNRWARRNDKKNDGEGREMKPGERLEERGEKREERGERLEKRGERLQEQAEKMEEMAERQRAKGHEKAAEKLERNAERKERRGERMENRGERMQRQGGRMQERGEKRGRK